jgi:hypothetical protein
MIAGFFRLKDRTSRRPGFATEPLPVHVWKRTKEVVRLFVAWAKFLKEMEEVWLQTRKKSEKEERWLEEIQRVQGEIWQALKIAEWQQVYSNAKASLPARAKALLDPFEELSSKILRNRNDLNAFLRKWDELQGKLQDLRAHIGREGGAAQRSLDELNRIHKNIRESIRAGGRIQEWQEAYSRLRHRIPLHFHLNVVKFDALNNRAFYSRQDLERVWDSALEHLRDMRLWNIRPWKLAATFARDVYLTTSFAFTYKTASQRD